jgi:hypothetical protein
MTTQAERNLNKCVGEWTRLLKALKADICDDYRASEDDDTPGMCVTIGVTIREDDTVSWSYQTGDNSFTGGAYSHPHWAVIYLYRRSNSRQLAEDAASQIADLVCQ